MKLKQWVLNSKFPFLHMQQLIFHFHRLNLEAPRTSFHCCLKSRWLAKFSLEKLRNVVKSVETALFLEFTGCLKILPQSVSDKIIPTFNSKAPLPPLPNPDIITPWPFSSVRRSGVKISTFSFVFLSNDVCELWK